jgi:hypothetical protein
MIISEFTFNRLKRDVPCRIIDKVVIKGKEAMIRLYEPVCYEDDASLGRAWDLCDRTNKAFDHYDKGDYNTALKLYEQIEDGSLKEIFIQKCRDGLRGDFRPWVIH